MTEKHYKKPVPYSFLIYNHIIMPHEHSVKLIDSIHEFGYAEYGYLLVYYYDRSRGTWYNI